MTIYIIWYNDFVSITCQLSPKFLLGFALETQDLDVPFAIYLP